MEKDIFKFSFILNFCWLLLNLGFFHSYYFLQRKLRHPNIVEFFGAAFRTVPRGVEAVFVLERPGVTLKSYLIDHPGNNPADNSMSVVNVIRWTQQIINALIAIHSMFHGSVHGDLRLENVLVSENSHSRDTSSISNRIRSKRSLKIWQ